MLSWTHAKLLGGNRMEIFFLEVYHVVEIGDFANVCSCFKCIKRKYDKVIDRVDVFLMHAIGLDLYELFLFHSLSECKIYDIKRVYANDGWFNDMSYKFYSFHKQKINNTQWPASNKILISYTTASIFFELKIGIVFYAKKQHCVFECLKMECLWNHHCISFIKFIWLSQTLLFKLRELFLSSCLINISRTSLFKLSETL